MSLSRDARFLAVGDPKFAGGIGATLILNSGGSGYQQAIGAVIGNNISGPVSSQGNNNGTLLH